MTNPQSDPATSPYLLVPIMVEALVVGGETDQQYPFLPKPPDYTQLSHWLNPDPEQNVSGPPVPLEQGIHLHWSLPSTLTHGVPDATSPGGMFFPCVPNRWLVLRMVHQSDSPPANFKGAWIIESDYLQDVDQAPTASYALPTFPQPGDTGNVSYIGRSWPWNEWTESSQTEPFLNALGAGEATFAAFYPNVRNVFGFFDSSDQLATISGPLSYLVVGWYSDETADPFSPAFQQQHLDLYNALRAQCNWSLPQQDAGATDQTMPPMQTLCHGMILDVPWGGDNQIAKLNFPDIRVAIGNTSAEALARLLADTVAGNPEAPSKTDPQNLEQLFAELQYGTLVQPDTANDSSLTKQQIHRARFASHPGGIYWSIIRQENAGAGGQTASVEPAEIAPEVYDSLALLNIAQQQSDALQRQRASLQRFLYTLWFHAQLDDFDLQTNYKEPPADIKQNIAAQTTLLTTKIEQINTNIAQLLQQIDQYHSELKELLKPAYHLASNAMEQFWRANDPVILIAGLGRVLNWGEDGRFSPTRDTLLCRRVEDTIAVQVLDTVTITAADLKLEIPMVAPIGAAISALAVEMFFIDPNSADAISAIAQSKPGVAADRLYIPQRNGVLWNHTLYPMLDYATLQSLSGFINSVPPSPIAIQFWQTPWSPLFLDWMINWFQEYRDQAQGLQQALDAWVIQGDYDYVYAGAPALAPPYTTYSSRTLLTPQVTLGLETALRNLEGTSSTELAQNLEDDLETAWLEQHLYRNEDSPSASTPKIGSLPDLVDAVGYWDVLSQALSVFTDLLAQRRPAALPPLSDPVYSQEIQALLATDQDIYNPLAAIPQKSAFSPIRAGWFQSPPPDDSQLSGLAVIDSFGRVSEVPNLGNISVYIHSSLTYGSDHTRVYLPPRIVQPSRLLSRLMSADIAPDDPDNARDLQTDPRSNPICGWILLNRLDSALAIYDADGHALGEISTLPHALQPWYPPPANATASGPESIKNPHLQRIVSTLLANAGALNDMTQLLDDASWTITLTGQISAPGMSAMVGYPLAIVRLQLQLELEGEPLRDQRIESTYLGMTYSWPDQLTFPVMLGESDDTSDGLIGFFRDDEIDPQSQLFQHFHAVQPASNTAAGPTFIDTINTVPLRLLSQDLGQLSAGSDGTILPSNDQNLLPRGACLTLLLDPRGAVSVIPAILPVQRISLPPGLVQDALHAIDTTFRAGPVLTDPALLNIPLPSPAQGNWAWLDRPTPQSWAVSTPTTSVDDRAHLTDPGYALMLREGWLWLAGAWGDRSPGLLTYSIQKASSGSFDLQMTCTNEGAKPAELAQIQFSFPIGASVSDLIAMTPAAARVVVPPQSPPPTWAARLATDVDRLTVVLVPSWPASAIVLQPGDSAIFGLSGVTPNQNIANATVNVTEQYQQGIGFAEARMAATPAPAGR